MELIASTLQRAEDLNSGYDCAWIVFSDRKDSNPLLTIVLQHIDWKMKGVVSRFLLLETSKAPMTTFIPTRNKLPIPMVALQYARNLEMQSLFKSCEGMKLERIICICEDLATAKAIELEIKNSRNGFTHRTFPKSFTIAYDSKASRESSC